MKRGTCWLRLGAVLGLLVAVTGTLCACQAVRGSETVSYYAVNLKAGDIDGNGKVALADATLLRQYLVGEITLSETQKTKADLDSDGKITAKDVYILVKSIPKMEPGMPDIGPL